MSPQMRDRAPRPKGPIDSGEDSNDESGPRRPKVDRPNTDDLLRRMREGEFAEGERVLLVEDLTTDGGSKLSFVDAIRETGATCGHTAVIFYYGIFPETEKTLGDHGVQLHHLCTWWDVLAEAKSSGSFAPETLTEVEAFLNAPRDWQEKNKRG